MGDTKDKEKAGQAVPTAAADEGQNATKESDSTPAAAPVEKTPKPAEKDNTLPDNKEHEAAAEEKTNTSLEDTLPGNKKSGEATKETNNTSLGKNLPDNKKSVAATEEKNDTSVESIDHQTNQDDSSSTPLEGKETLVKPDTEPTDAKTDAAEPTGNEPADNAKTESRDLPPNNKADDEATTDATRHVETAEPTGDTKTKPSEVPKAKTVDAGNTEIGNKKESVTPPAATSDMKPATGSTEELKNGVNEKDITMPTPTPTDNGNTITKNLFLLDENHVSEGGESGTEEEQSAFMKELENFFRERSLEFKPPKFYGEGLNCLK